MTNCSEVMDVAALESERKRHDVDRSAVAWRLRPV